MFDVADLEKRVGQLLSQNRFFHTISVKETAQMLANLCAPECLEEITVAALLHDIAKEFSSEQLLSVISEPISDEILASPAVLHSIAAPYLIKSQFPEYATKNVLSATYNHTLGSPDMTVFDEIVFLSDYIEATRPYDSCKLLRNEVFSKMKEGQGNSNIRILHSACIKAIDFIVNELEKRKRPVISKMLLTKNALMSKI